MINTTILQSDRDDKGRFQAGNRIGLTSPQVKIAALLRQTYADELTPEVLSIIVRRHVELIHQNEDIRVATFAIQLLYERIAGKPKEHVEIERKQPLPFDVRSYSDQQIATILHELNNPANLEAPRNSPETNPATTSP